MAKFNTAGTKTATSSPVTSEHTSSGTTYEGAPGFARDARSELFLLAVSNMVGEDTFYEGDKGRDSRYASLVRQLAIEDPDWTGRFLHWLRTDGNMRSAPLVGAAEFAKARVDAAEHGHTRQVIDSVMQRADEPGEFLAYWMGTYGRPLPMPIKRGVADAVWRLYDERATLKYDSDAHGWRFGDVVEMVHPTGTLKDSSGSKPIKGTWRGDLYEHLIDRRHGRDNLIPESLAMIRARVIMNARHSDPDPEHDDRRWRLATPGFQNDLRAAGASWEWLAGWLQGPMDAVAWQSVIPSMGYMALLRNLRNLDEAGVSDEVAATVAAKLADPEQVARSRQLPMRFLSAYRAAPSLRWSYPLEQAMGHSLANIPQVTGRTLILVDTSSSMRDVFSKDGTLMRWDAAALFGIALGSRCASADVVSFSSAQRYYSDPPGSNTREFPLQGAESLLRAVERWKSDGYFLGGGTDTEGALRKHFAGHDRVVILTDEQAERGEVGALLPGGVPLYAWNLAGYKYGQGPSGSGNRHTFGGLTDAAFRMIHLLEAGKSASWPF